MNRLLAPFAALLCLFAAPAYAAPVTFSISLGDETNAVDAVRFTADPATALDTGTGLYLYLNLAGTLTVEGTGYAFSGAALTANVAAAATSYAFSIPGSYGVVSGLTLSLLASPASMPTDAASALLALRDVISGGTTTAAGPSAPGPATASIPAPGAMIVFVTGLIGLAGVRRR